MWYRGKYKCFGSVLGHRFRLQAIPVGPWYLPKTVSVQWGGMCTVQSSRPKAKIQVFLKCLGTQTQNPGGSSWCVVLIRDCLSLLPPLPQHFVILQHIKIYLNNLCFHGDYFVLLLKPWLCKQVQVFYAWSYLFFYSLLVFISIFPDFLLTCIYIYLFIYITVQTPSTRSVRSHFFLTKVLLTFESMKVNLIYEFYLKDIATTVSLRAVLGLSTKK